MLKGNKVVCKTGNHRPNIGNHILCKFCRDWLWLPSGGQKLSLIQFFPKATHLVAQRHWSNQTGCGHSSALAKGQVSISCQHTMGWFLLIGRFVLGKKLGMLCVLPYWRVRCIHLLPSSGRVQVLGFASSLWKSVVRVGRRKCFQTIPLGDVLLTHSSTHCSKLAKDLVGRWNLRWLWMWLGLPYLTKI